MMLVSWYLTGYLWHCICVAGKNEGKLEDYIDQINDK